MKIEFDTNATGAIAEAVAEVLSAAAPHPIRVSREDEAYAIAVRGEPRIYAHDDGRITGVDDVCQRRIVIDRLRYALAAAQAAGAECSAEDESVSIELGDQKVSILGGEGGLSVV